MQKILTLLEANEWSKWLSSLPSSYKDVYFSPDYYSLYQAYGDGEANCYVFIDGDKVALYPFMKNSINILGYELDKDYYDIQGAYGYNGLIANTQNTTFINEVWHRFDEWCQQHDIVAEFMRFHPIINNYELAGNHFHVIYDRETVYIDLSQSLEEIFQGCEKSTRQHIRKAMKSIEIQPAFYSEENVKTFYQIYHENMVHVNSIPYLFFNEDHFRRMFHNENIEFFIAYQDNTPIACYSGLVSKDYYSNYLRASKTDYNKTGVNTLMYCSMIQSAKAHGCKYVHLGGGSNDDPENSLLKYKMNYSKTLSHFYIGKRIHNPIVYNDIVRQWKERHPDSFNNHSKMLLGYREIK